MIKSSPFEQEIPNIFFMPEGVRVYLCGTNKHLYALVDPIDAHLVYGQRWYLSNGYATSNTHRLGSRKGEAGGQINKAMHRLITSAPEGFVADHINGNRLDNRRRNLRVVRPVANNWNRDLHREPTKTRSRTGFRGVVEDQRSPGSFCARVGTKSYGQWPDAKTAARVYDEVVRRLHGDHVIPCNFPGEPLPPSFQIPGLERPLRYAKHQSSVVGVTWFSPRNTWRVIVAKKTMGYFQNQEEAENFRHSLDDTSCV